MIPRENKSCNVFVGAETGILKGVTINAKESSSKNFHRLKSLKKENEITALNWISDGEILLGTRGQKVSGFDTSDNSFTHGRNVEDGSNTPIRGLGRLPDETLVTASESGIVKIWGTKEEELNVLDEETLLNSTRKSSTRNLEQRSGDNPDSIHDNNPKKGRKLVSMKLRGSLIATGGQEHNLLIHDIGASPRKVVFRAKNVKNDMLQLRVPIWISDMAFLGETDSILSTVSRYGHVRLYDTRAQRKPVVSFGYSNDEPLTAMACTGHDKRILVGTAHGGLALYDLQMGVKGMVRKYKGSVGSIRSIAYENGHFASVGLDRFLRVYTIENRVKHSKLYLKSRLNTVVLKKGFDPDFEECDGDSDIEIVDDDEAEEEIIWSNMESLSEEKPSRKRKIQNN
ncbi:WD repeat-containing protein 74 [Lepeophtheirus salmonis]|uniref:WD repeat-containing protein 74 n=1 Tax=Lepeophtheirus salmonis TaxID=72036 RepID=UPI001AE8D819|nr:WD repeat-containing protein 74-like [Lepeophtheirus salmonis]